MWRNDPEQGISKLEPGDSLVHDESGRRWWVDGDQSFGGGIGQVAVNLWTTHIEYVCPHGSCMGGDVETKRQCVITSLHGWTVDWSENEKRKPTFKGECGGR